MAEANEILHKTGEKLGETLEQVRKTTMRASEKVQSCFDARLGSLIVGIIMAVISGLAVMACIGGFIFINVLTSMGYDLDWRRPTDTFRVGQVVYILISNALITVGLIFSLLEFSFAVVLADGASKKKIGHLKAYFIYGNVKSAIAFIVSIVLFITVWDNAPGSLVLLLSGINITVTMMVYMAYKTIKKSAKGYSKFDSEVPEEE